MLFFPLSAWCNDAYRSARTGTLGIRMDGGVSWSLGTSFEKPAAKPVDDIQPQGGMGIYYNISPLFRVGADYSYTRMLRENLNSTMKPLPNGGMQGTVYTEIKTQFHGVSLDGELNLLALGGDAHRLSLYVGTGAGMLFSIGNNYSLTVSQEFMDNGTGTVFRFLGHNEDIRYKAFYVPASLSVEYAFLPQVALSVRGEYRYVVRGCNYSLPGQVSATLGLRFNLF